MTEHEKDAVVLAFELARENNAEQVVLIGGQEFSIRPVQPDESRD